MNRDAPSVNKNALKKDDLQCAAGLAAAPAAQASPQAEALIVQIRESARNLYETRQMLCAEAVLAALNSGLRGGLSQAQVIAMAAPFCVAMGDSGCLCGALSGAVMGYGLLSGGERPYRRRRQLRADARHLHDAFKAAYGATCCRVLSKKLKHDSKAHFQQCAGLTAGAAELAAREILRQRPELLAKADQRFLTGRHSRMVGALLRLRHYFLR
jgi:C_GCAxxG_C_C family probable redox protein